MKLTSIRYFIKQAFSSLIRNALLSFASILTISSCIFILIVSFTLAKNLEFMLDKFQNSISFTIFLNDSVTEDDLLVIEPMLLNIDNISNIEYISKEQAFDDFNQTLGEDNKILEGLPRETLLPASYNIYLKDNNQSQDTINQLEEYVGENTYFSSIRYDYAAISSLASLNKWITIISGVLITGLAFIGIIIITNTIKIAMNSREKEINIMKYLGATDWFIRWPFVIESIIIGLVGALIPLIITFAMYNTVMETLGSHLSFLRDFYQYINVYTIFAMNIPIAIGLGVFIAIIGGGSSIRKYLRV